MNPLIRLPLVLQARGNIGKSKHYRDIADGLYTPPVKIGDHCSAWPESEVSALNSAAIAGFSREQTKALVAQLVARRTNPGCQLVAP